jgi:disulfide bond formation protein DsbB
MSTASADNRFRRLADLSPDAAAWLTFGVTAATIAGAWVFEKMGYAPCDLCLQQRWAYYIGVPLALAAALASPARPRLGGWLLAGVALIFAGSAVFASWHAGVEWGFWPGPAGCSGAAVPRAGDMNDFLRQIEATRLVRCDEVALRIFGLSLAAWNAVISAAVSALSGAVARRALRSPRALTHTA